MFGLQAHYNLRGQYTLGQRIAAAEAESALNARDALRDAGRALARGDGAAWREACILAAAHYRCAGEHDLAAHWTRRAKV